MRCGYQDDASNNHRHKSIHDSIFPWQWGTQWPIIWGSSLVTSSFAQFNSLHVYFYTWESDHASHRLQPYSSMSQRSIHIFAQTTVTQMHSAHIGVSVPILFHLYRSHHLQNDVIKNENSKTIFRRSSTSFQTSPRSAFWIIFEIFPPPGVA